MTEEEKTRQRLAELERMRKALEALLKTIQRPPNKTLH
jgi:hypothetical protein